MKKTKLFVIFFSLIITNLCFAQSGWFWQNPLPTGNDYESVGFYDENIGYAVGWHGTVAKTTNGGGNWFMVNNGVMALIGNGYYAGTLRCVHVLDPNTVIAAGNGIIKTTNGGLNWTFLSNIVNTLSDMYFIDNNIGYITSGNKIYQTLNGGVNWNTTSIIGTWSSVQFVNPNTGYVGGNGNILKTTNGGLNWAALYLGVSINTIQFTNEETGYCAGSRNIYKTTNSGINWIIKFTTNYHSGGELSFSNNDTGYYCNWSGKVFKTLNGGESWDSTIVGGLITSLKSAKSNLCVVVGTGGQIYKTSNTGINWNCISSNLGNLNSLNDITFPTQNIGYICGVEGNILKSTNGGNSWFKTITNVTNTLYDIYFLDQQTGFSCGFSGKVIYTSNGGQNWDSLRSVISFSLESVYFLNNNTGFVSGSSNLFKTTNKGVNWYTVQNDQTIKSIQFINSTTGYCVGLYRIGCPQCPPPQTHVLKTTNVGETWNQICFLNNSYFINLQMIDENIGYASEEYLVRKTSNGGLTWNIIYSQGGNGLYFTDQNTGYLTGYKTTNGGINWYSQYVDIERHWLINSITFINQNTGFMVGGYGGTIIKTTDGGGTMIPIGISSIYEEIPQIFNLSQNYPNPFNPQTKIKFDVPKASFTKLVIYDLLGREVTTLVNEELKPGTYEADWDGSNYSSGVYFYKIISGDFVETKKMLMVK